jgi:N-acetylmuramoyl-L-alanine amidase
MTPSKFFLNDRGIRCGMLAALLWLACGLSLSFAGFTVVIDPGHGGAAIPGKSDSTQEGDGASWNNAHSATQKLLEKDLTLSYALAVKRAIEASAKAREMQIRVVLTRETDVHHSAMERAAVAVRESADVLLSIHFNAANGKAEGTRAYYCSAEHPAWQFMHFTNAYEARDKKFCETVAAAVAQSLASFGGKPEKHAVKGDVDDRKDGLRILGYARQDTHLRNAALALLEIEFIDNPDVETWLLSDANKPKTEQAVGEAVTQALCEWFSQPPAARDIVEKARKSPGRQ